MSRRDDERLLEQLEQLMRDERQPPADRVALLRAQAEERRRAGARTPARPLDRRGLLLGGAAASLGAVAGAGAVALTGDDAASAPTEAVAVSVQRDGVSAGAKLINHTWGVEYMLEASGLSAGDRYRVVYETTDGERVSAGSFLGIDGTVSCRMTAAVPRDRTRTIEVLDDRDDAVVLRTRLA